MEPQGNLNKPLTSAGYEIDSARDGRIAVLRQPRWQLLFRQVLTVRGACITAALLAYCGCALMRIFSLKPTNNEAWFANPAIDLMLHHRMGTPTIDGAGTALADIGQHTYWTLPFYSLAQVPWYSLFGFSLIMQRLFTLFCGIGLLVCVYMLVKKLSSEWAAALSVILIACDFQFVEQSAVGRMDMLCALLAFAGLALYVNLRDTRLREALLLSNAAVALSCMTHPCASLGLTSLWELIFYFDRKRLGWREVGLTAAPYVTVLALWGVYISRAPQSFLLQFRANIGGLNAEAGGSGRFSLLLHPLSALIAELHHRYRVAYHAWVIPVVYISGLLVLMLLARRTRRTDHLIFAAIGFIYFTELTLLDGLKRPWYLVHSIPVLAIALALVLCSGKVPRRLAVAMVALLLCFQAATEVQYVHDDWAARSYLSVLQILESNRKPDEVVIAPSEFAYGLGFEGQVVGDWHIGYYSGKSPGFIVVGSLAKSWISAHRRDTPELQSFIDERLGREYVVVFDDPLYTVYAKRARATGLNLDVSSASNASVPKLLWELRTSGQQ